MHLMQQLNLCVYIFTHVCSAHSFLYEAVGNHDCLKGHDAVIISLLR